MKKRQIVENVRTVGVWIALLGYALAPGPAPAAGPFDSFGGQWAGSGTMTLNDGSTERLRCHASYEVSGNSLTTKLACATESYKIDARSNLQYRDGFINGSWREISHNLGGEVSGSVSGNTVRANFESGGTTLLGMTMVTSSAKQSVSIRPQSGTPIKGVQISLTRK